MRSQPEKAEEYVDMKSLLAKKLSEISTLHETIFDEHNRLIQENIKLTQELYMAREESKKALAMKEKVKS